MSDWAKYLDDILASNQVKITFSRNCHSGIASMVAQGHQCGCWRCRESRGEPWDDVTEAQAAADSAVAQKAMRVWAVRNIKAADAVEREGKG